MRGFDVDPDVAAKERAESEEERVARRNAEVMSMIDSAIPGVSGA